MTTKILTKLISIIFLLFSFSFVGKTQVLVDTLKNSFQKKFAAIFKEKKVKRIYYTYTFPILDSMSFTFKSNKPFSKWSNDTLTISENYDTNGYFTSRSETLPNGKVQKLNTYFYDSLGNVIKTVETNNGRLRQFDYLAQEFIYDKGQIKNIKKVKYYLGDTINSVETFFYSHERLTQVIELSERNELLMSSLFIYPQSEKYVKEEYLEERNGCEVRTTYYYTFDKLGRISKVYGAYDYFIKRQKPIEKFTYNFVKEAYIFETQLKKIEKYK